ncbi:MAG: DUF4393 domain-containing protein [Peptoniphilus harei]|nr:DUF4393 domain-containing protein [Peptoniphilus harei]
MPDLINEAVTPVARSAGETIASIWDIVFGGINVYSEKQKYLRELNFEKFKESLTKKVADIPIEDIQEPNLSIIGPTLEKSKYYFEEEKLRELFANLVASSINKTKADIIHPAYPGIIQNLSPNDAEFLKEISSLEVIPFCMLRYQKRSKDNQTTFFSYFGDGITLSRCILKYTYQENPFYDFNPTIDNLSRLKLIEVTDKFLSDESNYSDFLDNSIYKQCQAELSHDSQIMEREVTMIKGVIEVTSFGKNFIKTCVV